MKKKRIKLKDNKRKIVRELKQHIKTNKTSFAVYVVLRIFVIFAMVLSVFRGAYENLFMCSLALVLFLAPAFFEKNFGIDLPTTLEIIILLFIFASMILGEIGSFYMKVPMWDTILHTVNGFVCAGVGFSLVDILNRSERFSFRLSPMYVAIVAFCFSMTIGVLWEVFEFSFDMLFGTDMQKDFVITKISTVTLDETLSNKPVLINNINHTSVNGVDLHINGYLDIGLIDTMKDLIVNFFGAVIFSVLGFFHVKYRGKYSFASKFIPKVNDKEERQNNGEIVVGDDEKLE